jgi:hypothetical protein
VLCGICVVLGLAALMIGVLAWTGQPAADSSMRADEFYAGARVLVTVGGVLTVPFAVAPLLPRTPTTWGVHLFLLTVAMFFVIPMIIAIPVAIGWFGDDLKRSYDMDP